MEDHAATLVQYREQLEQVEGLLKLDSENQQFNQLRDDLQQVIKLTLLSSSSPGPVLSSSGAIATKEQNDSDERLGGNGAIQLGEVVEVTGGDRLYAGVVTGIINEEEYKIKYYNFGSEVSLPITSIQRINLTHELIRPKASITVGTKCLCKFGADGKFYDVEVSEITKMGYNVIWSAYGNSEEVPYVYLKPIEESAQQKQKKDQPALSSSSALIPIPENLQIKPTDTEEEKNRKQKKIKAIKSKNRIISKDVEAVEVQKTWQTFVSKTSKKKSSVGSVIKSASMFKSSDDTSAKVGVTGGGRGVTKFADRKKYTFTEM